MARKPYIYTIVSYIENRSGDGSVRCQEKLTCEQVRLPDGSYHSTVIKREVVMPEAEQIECCKKMMKNAGESLSEYLTSRPDGPYSELA